ncbi:MAG: aminodeoxychorismate/anthranilate synthase component II [Halovenus sp.]
MSSEPSAAVRARGQRVLVVDNYDSFAYNLVQYVGSVVTGRTGDTGGESEAGDGSGDPEAGEVIVRRNDRIDLAGVDALDPDAVVISPGPGTPAEAGISIPLFAERTYPTLGVCLGHQALCSAHGAPVGHADSVVHGKPSTITHDGRGVFDGFPGQFDVGRYHSLAVEREDLPDILTETAQTDDEATVVMGVRHDSLPHVGVQFHPESILTEDGIDLVANFLAMAAEHRE